MVVFAGLACLGLILGRYVSVMGLLSGVLGLAASAILIHQIYGTDPRLLIGMLAAQQICFQAAYLVSAILPRCPLRS